MNETDRINHSASIDRRRALAVVGFVVATLLAAGIGGLFMPGQWYEELAKPGWTPPGWVFGPVWAILYFLIAVAGVIGWNAPTVRPRATAWWAAQMVLNGAWSWAFFGLQSPGIALAVIAGMLITIVGFIVTCWRDARAASWLFVPYLAWVSFAGLLNLAIFWMN